MGDIDAAIKAVQEGMAVREASRTFDVARTTLRRHLNKVEIPYGFNVKGTSTFYGPDGELRGQWVKTAVDQEEQERIFRAALEGFKEQVVRVAPAPMPKDVLVDLANCYVITDYHIGGLSWKEETGEDWDIKIAEKTLVGCFGQMMNGAPDARVGIVAQLGDFLHSDGAGGMSAITPLSGNVLDQDSRFPLMVRTAIKLLRIVIDMALQKHEKVIVILGEGNHDLSSSVWLREMFAALYEDEPRVEVDTSILPYYAVQHGETMLAFHHGHMKRFNDLVGTFASQFSHIWGATSRRYGHCGHYHHMHSKEHMGMTLTQHRTLCSKDAYAARHGWFAETGAQCITYHTKHGQVATNNVTPGMLDE